MSFFGATTLRGKILVLKIGFAVVVVLVGLVTLYFMEKRDRPAPRVDPAKEQEEIAAGLKSEDPAARSQAYARLGKYRPLTKESIDSLAAGMADKDAPARASAAKAMAEVAPVLESKPEWAAPAAAAAAKALDDPDIAVALPAIAVVSQSGEAGKQALDPLKKQLQAKDAERRLAAAGAVFKLDPTAAGEAVAVATALIEDSNEAIRLQAVQMLARVGPPAKETAPQLLKIAAGKQDRKLRIAAAEAVLRVDPDETPQVSVVLVALIKEIDVETGGKLKKPSLGKGPDGKVVVANMDALGHPLGVVRADALRVLRNVDAKAADAVNQ